MASLNIGSATNASSGSSGNGYGPEILEDGVVTKEETGTDQGSVISPLLANIYLHFVFDLWAERWRRREATGDMIMVRFADDSGGLLAKA